MRVSAWSIWRIAATPTLQKNEPMNKSIFRLVDMDSIEKFTLVILFGFLLARMLAALFDNSSIINLIYVFDQLLVLVFILIRRKTEVITKRPSDWLIAFIGTFLPFLFVPVGSTPIVPVAVAVLIMFTGIAVHLTAKLTLRRSFGVVAANRGIKVNGPYRLVRHPMYAGYMLVQIGFLLGGPTLPNLILIMACWVLIIMRIKAEEHVLSQDPKYVHLLDQTRFRLFPGIY